MLGLRFCARTFCSCGERGPLFIAVCRPLIVVASFVAEHRLQTHRLSSCGSRAQLLRSMWDLPRPGLKPVSPALAGRFSTTAPPGKPSLFFLMSLANGLSVLFIFSKNQLLVLLIFAVVFFVSISFISALVFMISFLLLTLGFVYSSFSSSFRCKVRLFI